MFQGRSTTIAAMLLALAGFVMASTPAQAEPLEVAGLTGDPDQGERIYKRCMACHSLAKGENKVGPSLYGIFGRPAGTVEGFRYSDANLNSGVTWTPEIMFEYLENPRSFMKGTRMAFPGLRPPQQRADVLAYIAANGGFGDDGAEAEGEAPATE